MAGKDTAAVKAGAGEPRRRLWRVVRAMLYMMRRGMPSGRKLAMDLHVLLRRRHCGKIGGKAELSWSNGAPASSALLVGGHGLGATERRHQHGEDDYDETDIARMFEMLNDNAHLFDDDEDALSSATPSPPSSLGRSPMARQMRIAASPFGQEQVDVKADDFIRRFYEELRAQKSVTATPDYYGGYATTGSYNGRHSARSVAAGMA